MLTCFMSHELVLVSDNTKIIQIYLEYGKKASILYDRSMKNKNEAEMNIRRSHMMRASQDATPDQGISMADTYLTIGTTYIIIESPV